MAKTTRKKSKVKRKSLLGPTNQRNRPNTKNAKKQRPSRAAKITEFSTPQLVRELYRRSLEWREKGFWERFEAASGHQIEFGHKTECFQKYDPIIPRPRAPIQD